MESSPSIPIILDNVMCIGNETSLLQCSYDRYDHHEGHYKQLRVVECMGKCSQTGMHISVTSHGRLPTCIAKSPFETCV